MSGASEEAFFFVGEVEVDVEEGGIVFFLPGVEVEEDGVIFFVLVARVVREVVGSRVGIEMVDIGFGVTSDFVSLSFFSSSDSSSVHPT